MKYWTLVLCAFSILYAHNNCQSQSLEVDGTINIGNDNDSPTEGAIRWNGADFQGWNGTKWISLSGPVFGTVQDIDGNIYRTVVIGDQEWMTQNLRVTKFNSNDLLFKSEKQEDWDFFNGLGIGSYCSYDYNTNNSDQYGHLYNGWAVRSTLNVCPEGWHVPTITEFTILGDYVALQMGSRGGSLKAMGLLEFSSGLWLAPNTNATDNFGFKALPGGMITSSATFLDMNAEAVFWTSTPFSSTLTRGVSLRFDNDNLAQSGGFSNDSGRSIRCIKD